MGGWGVWGDVDSDRRRILADFQLPKPSIGGACWMLSVAKVGTSRLIPFGMESWEQRASSLPHSILLHKTGTVAP